MKAYLILIAIYIAQILIVFAYPYYKYRKDCQTKRTIGGLMSYMYHQNMGFLKPCAFIPFFGIAALILTGTGFLMFVSLAWIYERFIKNIKI